MWFIAKTISMIRANPDGNNVVYITPASFENLQLPDGSVLDNSQKLMRGIMEIIAAVPRITVKIEEGDAVVCNNIRYLHGAAGKPPDQGGTQEPRKLYVMHFAGL